jgi:outer membrane protein TolC
MIFNHPFKPILAITLLLASFVLASSTLASVALAQAPNKLFTLALERSVPYSLAKSDLKSATEKLERVKSDPLAIKPDLLEAQIAFDAARVGLTSSNLEVRRNLSRELFAWLEAQDTLDLAKLKNTLAAANLNAARVRFKTGAINQIEVNRSEAEARSAETDQDNASADLEAAAATLRTRLGELPAANLTLEPTPKPNRATLEAGSENQPLLVKAKGGVDRAKLDLEIKDNEFTASVDVQAAKTALTNAQRNLEDARSTAKSSLSATWDAFTAAQKAIPVRERSATVAKEDLSAQQARFAKGLISTLAVLQAQITLESAQLALSQAQHRLTLSVVELAASANLDLWAK